MYEYHLEMAEGLTIVDKWNKLEGIISTVADESLGSRNGKP